MALIDNLISYWKLDETSGTRGDAHGANNLTDNNTVGYAAGILNNAADFESTNSEYLSITDASQSGLDITGDLTMSCWINRESDASQHVMGKRDGGSGASGRAYVMYLDGNTATDISVNISSGATDTWKFVSYTFSTGTWYHVAIVYTASAGSAKFYVNGSQTGTTQSGLPTSIGNNSQPFTIGREAVTGGLFDGLIDEVGIWSRALSDSEITELYGSGTPPAYPFTGGGSATPTLLMTGVGT